MKLLLIQNSSGETNSPVQNHCTLHIVHCTLEEARGSMKLLLIQNSSGETNFPMQNHCALCIEKGVKI